MINWVGFTLIRHLRPDKPSLQRVKPQQFLGSPSHGQEIDEESGDAAARQSFRSGPATVSHSKEG